MNYANNHSSIISTSSNEPFALGLLQPEEGQEPAAKKSRADGRSVSMYQQVDSYLPAQPLQAHPAVSTKRKVRKRKFRKRKVHKCDHYQCDYSTKYIQNLNQHKRTHLSADQRLKDHKCEQCDYSTDRNGDLKRHQWTHLPPGQRPKDHKCDQCHYSTEYIQNLNQHKRTHKPADQRPKDHKCDQCHYSTEYKQSLKKHRRTHKPAGANLTVAIKDLPIVTNGYRKLSQPKTDSFKSDAAKKRCYSCKKSTDSDDERSRKRMRHNEISSMSIVSGANKIDDIQIIKQEPVCNHGFHLKHRTDNRAPLWTAEPSIKQEFTELEPNKNNRTYFTQIGIPQNDEIRRSINEAISFYKGLNNEARERYLNERLSVQKHDGSIFSELKGQDEVIAKRNLAQWEILGHYAGKHYTDASYSNGAKSMGTTLTNIDRYSFTTTQGQFISGFRSGNVTTLINACKIYSETEKGRNLPEQNVSYMRHTDEQGKWIVFIIALQGIKAGVRLWADYGKQYWESMGSTIEISDNEDDAE